MIFLQIICTLGNDIFCQTLLFTQYHIKLSFEYFLQLILHDFINKYADKKYYFIVYTFKINKQKI